MTVLGYFMYINISPSACPVGTYSNSKGYPCQPCPANSEAIQTGLSECPCVLHYYRAASEGPSVACTREFSIVQSTNSSRLMHETQTADLRYTPNTVCRLEQGNFIRC